jgi:adenylate kinase
MRQEKSCDLIIAFGPPGCGKGTVADEDKKRGRSTSISTGNILRQQMADGTELGKSAKAFIDKGALVPDDVINGMIKAWFDKNVVIGARIIFDGYPRTAIQAEQFVKLAQEKPFCGVKVIRFTIAKNVVVERSEARMVCGNKACQKVYSLKVTPPKVAGICDACGGALIKRSDDTKEVMEKRYDEYMQQEKPILDVLKKHYTVTDISAEQSMDAAYQAYVKATA